MSRRKREDGPGVWHHVTNRGIARRAMFEGAEDARHFQSFVAREVRRGSIEVHFFCVMTTHFHLLVRSVTGELSSTMRRLSGRYSRHFNRGHRRDGTLVRGRFFSKRVRSTLYRRTLVSDIDFNPVQARMATHTWDYRFGSARFYVHGRAPPWLTTSWVEAEVMRPSDPEEPENLQPYSGSAYIKRFGRRHGDFIVELVERRLASRGSDPDDLDSLIEAAPPRVLHWMQRKARLADGERVGEPVVTQGAVDGGLEHWPAPPDEAAQKTGGKSASPKALARVGLLRSMAAMTWAEIARTTNLSESTCRRHYERYQQLVLHDPHYAKASSECAHTAVCLTLGVHTQPGNQTASVSATH